MAFSRVIDNPGDNVLAEYSFGRRLILPIKINGMFQRGCGVVIIAIVM